MKWKEDNTLFCLPHSRRFYRAIALKMRLNFKLYEPIQSMKSTLWIYYCSNQELSLSVQNRIQLEKIYNICIFLQLAVKVSAWKGAQLVFNSYVSIHESILVTRRRRHRLRHSDWLASDAIVSKVKTFIHNPFDMNQYGVIPKDGRSRRRTIQMGVILCRHRLICFKSVVVSAARWNSCVYQHSTYFWYFSHWYIAVKYPSLQRDCIISSLRLLLHCSIMKFLGAENEHTRHI